MDLKLQPYTNWSMFCSFVRWMASTRFSQHHLGLEKGFFPLCPRCAPCCAVEAWARLVLVNDKLVDAIGKASLAKVERMNQQDILLIWVQQSSQLALTWQSMSTKHNTNSTSLPLFLTENGGKYLIISFVSLKICELERIWPTQLGAMQHWRFKMLPWSTPLPTGHWRCIPPRPRWRFPGYQGISPRTLCSSTILDPSNWRCWDPVGPRSLVTLLSWPGRWLSTVLRTEGGKVLRGCSDACQKSKCLVMIESMTIYDVLQIQAMQTPSMTIMLQCMAMQMSWKSHSLSWECFEECLILTCFRLSLATVPLMSSIAELILKQIEAKSSGPQEGYDPGRAIEPVQTSKGKHRWYDMAHDNLMNEDLRMLHTATYIITTRFLVSCCQVLLQDMEGIFLMIHGARKLQSHDLMAATANG